ncbi:MAG: hypothetical protein ABEI98_01015 [Halorhabdus sp.]
MTRYRTVVEGGTVYVESTDADLDSGGSDHVSGADRLEIGSLADILEVTGGHSWTITYTDDEKRRHPKMDTTDEGLTVDVVDMMQAMTHSDVFIETLATYPAEPPGDDPEAIAPRLGLFAGTLLANLENGLD